MCRRVAWIELAVKKASVVGSRSEAHGKKRTGSSGRNCLFDHLQSVTAEEVPAMDLKNRETAAQPEAQLRLDQRFMKAALVQARKAEALDEVPIGCVIVYEGKIIARGYNRRNTDRNTLSHAEMNAIRKASRRLGDWRLEGCTIYITLEPCQMCSGAIVQSRIDRCVIGAMNPKAGCAGSVLNMLQIPRFNHQVEITKGVLGEECSTMLSDFFRRLRTRDSARQPVIRSGNGDRQ